MTWLEPMFHADLARSCPQLLALAETAYDPRTSDTERATLLKRLASASRTLHDLQRSQIGRSQAPSPDLELVAKAADYLTSTAAALGHVFSYLPAGEAWVPTVCALAQRIPTARPGRITGESSSVSGNCRMRAPAPPRTNNWHRTDLWRSSWIGSGQCSGIFSWTAACRRKRLSERYHILADTHCRTLAQRGFGQAELDPVISARCMDLVVRYGRRGVRADNSSNSD